MTKATPDQRSAKWVEQTRRKEARRGLRLTISELDGLQKRFAAAMDEVDECHRQLATRLTRIERDIKRLLGDETDED